MKYIFLLFSLAFLSSCSATYIGKDICKADEFVADSYLIREGKLSILSLEGKVIEEIPSDMMEEYPDAIHENDILSIGIYHPSRKDMVVAVEDLNKNIGYRVIDGKVLLPDAEEIPVTGLSLQEARQAIKCYYTQDSKIKDVDVFLDYKKRPLHKVELIGLVSKNTIPVDGKMRLYDALAQANIDPSANLFMSYVVRDGEYLPVDINKLVNEGDMSQNIVMKGGDKIYIAPPQEANVMVMGEVGFPTAIPVTKGYISIKEALVKAHGIPYTGNRKGILVIRGNVLNPKIYLLTWNQIIHLPNDSTLLMPGDTVYVTSTLLADWNRFLSQLLPSLEGVRAASTTTSVIAP